MPESNNQMIATQVEWLTLQLAKSIKIIRDGRRSPEIFGALKRAVQAFNNNQPFQVIVNRPNFITIDRNESFNPQDIMGSGWSISSQDERSLALKSLDLNSIVFDSFLRGSEPYMLIPSEIRFSRLRNDHRVRLDARILQTLWESQYLIPDSWGKLKLVKNDINGRTIYIFFDGTIVKDEQGNEYILALCWNSKNGWFIYPRRTDDVWRCYHLSALVGLETLNS